MSNKVHTDYQRICFKVWGAVPIDVEWAKGTNIYQEAERKELLNRLVAVQECDATEGEQDYKS